MLCLRVQQHGVSTGTAALHGVSTATALVCLLGCGVMGNDLIGGPLYPATNSLSHSIPVRVTVNTNHMTPLYS